MHRRRHRILPFLLVALLVTWGTCPCVFAQMLRYTAEASHGMPPAAACCPACASKDEAPQEQPHAPDCPCCDSGGWIRDLPPQVQAVELEAPDLSVFDLPALSVAFLAVSSVDGDPVARATGPPDPLRLHAAPVGIVRLLN